MNETDQHSIIADCSTSDPQLPINVHHAYEFQPSQPSLPVHYRFYATNTVAATVANELLDEFGDKMFDADDRIRNLDERGPPIRISPNGGQSLVEYSEDLGSPGYDCTLYIIRPYKT